MLILGSGINHSFFVVGVEHDEADLESRDTRDIIDVPKYCTHCGSEIVIDDFDYGPVCPNEFCPERRLLIFYSFHPDLTQPEWILPLYAQ